MERESQRGRDRDRACCVHMNVLDSDHLKIKAYILDVGLRWNLIKIPLRVQAGQCVMSSALLLSWPDGSRGTL